MKPPGADLPIVVTKWYAYAKWLLERVESFPKSQRFILGQRLSNHAMDVLELLVVKTPSPAPVSLIHEPASRRQFPGHR